MELIITLIIWAAIIGIGLTIGQILLGLLIYIIMFAVYIVTVPFIWAYDKIKGVK